MNGNYVTLFGSPVQALMSLCKRACVSFLHSRGKQVIVGGTDSLCATKSASAQCIDDSYMPQSCGNGMSSSYCAHLCV